MPGFWKAVYTISAGEVKATRDLAQVGEQKSDASSDSSDEESTCMLQEVNPMGAQDNRLLLS